MIELISATLWMILSKYAQISEHKRFMRRALALARRGCGRVSPNPPVGAVVVKDKKIVGSGWHRSYGGAHAEIESNFLKLEISLVVQISM